MQFISHGNYSSFHMANAVLSHMATTYHFTWQLQFITHGNYNSTHMEPIVDFTWQLQIMLIMYSVAIFNRSACQKVGNYIAFYMATTVFLVVQLHHIVLMANQVILHVKYHLHYTWQLHYIPHGNHTTFKMATTLSFTTHDNYYLFSNYSVFYSIFHLLHLCVHYR